MKPMRILVFYDALHQEPIVVTMEQALAANLGAEVVRAGPVAAGEYFAIAGERPGRNTSITAILLRRFGSAFRSIMRTLLPGRLRLVPSWIRLLPSWIRRTSRTLPALLHHRIVSATGMLFKDRIAPITDMLVASAEAAWRDKKPMGSRAGRLAKAYLRGVADVRHRFGCRGIAILATITPFAAVGCLLGVDIARAALQRRRWLRDARSMVRRAGPDVALLLEDNVEGLTGAVSWAARRERVPLIVVPDYIPNPAEPAAFYFESPAHGTFGPRAYLVARFMPKWTYRYRDRSMLRLPARMILAYHLLRCDPPKPWILNSGYSAAIVLESEHMRRHYRALGFCDDKLAVIGSPRDDMLRRAADGAQGRRAVLMRKFGLDPSRRLVVCAFPPDQFNSPSPTPYEFADFETMADAWFAGFRAISNSANIFVKPHPRLPRHRLRRFDDGSIRILEEETTEVLLAMADLYVASASTTIRWALALGLPTLNYDTYRYGYGDFATARGVVEVDTSREFAQALDRLATDQSAYDELRAKAMADRKNWGLMDRNFGKRLAILVSDVSTRGDPRTSTHMVSPSSA